MSFHAYRDVDVTGQSIFSMHCVPDGARSKIEDRHDERLLSIRRAISCSVDARFPLRSADGPLLFVLPQWAGA